MDHAYYAGECREALSVKRGCVLEFVMKDNHTIGGDLENVVNLCRFIKEELGRL